MNYRFKYLILFLLLLFFFSACGSSKYITLLQAGDPRDVMGEYQGTPNHKGIITIQVIGKGIPPETATSRGQAQILAENAAVADGYRKLAEKINGIYVKEYSKMENGAIDYTFVQLETETWLRGTEVLEIIQRDNNITEAYMQAKVRVPAGHFLSGY